MQMMQNMQEPASFATPQHLARALQFVIRESSIPLADAIPSIPIRNAITS